MKLIIGMKGEQKTSENPLKILNFHKSLLNQKRMIQTTPVSPNGSYQKVKISYANPFSIRIGSMDY